MNEVDKAWLESIGVSYDLSVSRPDLDHTVKNLIELRKNEFLKLGLDPNDRKSWQMEPGKLDEVRRQTESQIHLGHPYGELTQARRVRDQRDFVLQISTIDDHDYTQD